MADRDDLKEMAKYFGQCYMNAAHGQAQLKFEGYMNTLKKAMELIDGQEPVKPIDQGDDSYVCDNCGETVGWEKLDVFGIDPVKYKFCPGCGRKVDWNG